MATIQITIFAFTACATPGPVNIIASILGAQDGIKSSLSFVLGATLGLLFVIFASSLGMSQILNSNETVANLMTAIGSIYLLYLALAMSKKSARTAESVDIKQASGFYHGALLQITNPKAWLVSMSGLAMYLDGSDKSELLSFISIFFIACFASVFTWTLIGKTVAAKLQSTHMMVFNRTMAALLSVLVLCNLANMSF